VDSTPKTKILGALAVWKHLNKKSFNTQAGGKVRIFGTYNNKQTKHTDTDREQRRRILVKAKTSNYFSAFDG